MILRIATPADAPAISQILQELTALGKRRRPDSAEFVLNHYIQFPERVQCTVATDAAGVILGFQSLKHAVPGNQYGVTPGWGIIGTHISPRAARKGVGRALFAATLEAAKNAELPSIDATIGALNAEGLAYYAAMGFTGYRKNGHQICKRFDLT